MALRNIWNWIYAHRWWRREVVEVQRPADTEKLDGCTIGHPVTHGRCQLAMGHLDDHVFPIDDAFINALDDGLLVIGRRPKKS